MMIEKKIYEEKFNQIHRYDKCLFTESRDFEIHEIMSKKS